MIISILAVLYQSKAHAEHGNNETPRIAVLFPTVSEQHSQMFDQIINGIRSIPGYSFYPFRVTSESNSDQLREWSEQNFIDGYIALGQSTYKLVLATETKLPLITGGMVSAPPGINGISLSADPEAFFRYLQLLNPGVTRVYYIYSQHNNGWLTERARKISREYKIEFIALEVNDIKEATLEYKIILKSIKSKTDALWLPLDNIAPLDFLLPDILKEAWDRNFVVFSNNLQHTRRGTLFSLYPDHYKQGRRLVAMMQRRLEDNNIKPVLLASIDLNIAVNIRTAAHLEMTLEKNLLDKFDQIYPANN
ncbi:MAG: hypothetical protein OEY61_05535 [Gammaproteobacteria bacterium]|nr:hypothetical protein [Gammaproteobacteria bacterium]